MNGENVLSLYQTKPKHRVILDDALLDVFFEQFQERKGNFLELNFGQWVDFKMWELSRK